MNKILTLCIVHKDKKVLLGMKKRGFGVGRWNGFGGKVEEGETVDEAMHREMKEEAGIELLDLTKHAVINFEFQNDPKIWEVHIYRATEHRGEPEETDEMKPQWFDESKIPFAEMWPDDELWMPLLLAGKKFQGTFLLDKPSDADYVSKIIAQNVWEVEGV